MNKNIKITLTVFGFAAILWAWWMVSETPQTSSNQDVAQLKVKELDFEKSQNTSGDEDPKNYPSGKQVQEISSTDGGVTTGEQIDEKTVEDSSLEVTSSAGRENTINTENATRSAERQKPSGDQQLGTNSTKLKTKPVSFPGIKQGVNDLMLSGLQYIPGENEDSFVATFQLTRSGDGFEGSAWIIGDYVQRGTKSLMSMPSHSSLNLTAEGAPKNPRVGVRVIMQNMPGKSLSKKFTVPRPGFEGEEISLVRVGIFDRKNGKLHVASVSAAQLGRKKSPRRARIQGP